MPQVLEADQLPTSSTPVMPPGIVSRASSATSESIRARCQAATSSIEPFQ
ncbi:hypothetical protein STANM309S_02950 [Streptomyces tanashiensis]